MLDKHAKFFVNLLGADNAYFDDAHRIAYCYDATKKRHLTACFSRGTSATLARF